MSAINIKRGDTSRLLTDTLTINGAPINLTGASVVLVFKDPDAGTTVRRNASIVSPSAGTVQYQLVSADVQNALTWLLEWEVTLSGGGVITIPEDGYFTMKVWADLG